MEAQAHAGTAFWTAGQQQCKGGDKPLPYNNDRRGGVYPLPGPTGFPNQPRRYLDREFSMMDTALICHLSTSTFEKTRHKTEAKETTFRFKGVAC